LIFLICIALSVAVIFYVFSVPQTIAAGPEATRLSFLQERKEAVYENLRDLNFEYKAGKVADQDYLNLKNSLESEAAGILAEIARLEAPMSRNKKDNKF
jgi:hypothetical protein